MVQLSQEQGPQQWGEVECKPVMVQRSHELHCMGWEGSFHLERGCPLAYAANSSPQAPRILEERSQTWVGGQKEGEIQKRNHSKMELARNWDIEGPPPRDR